MNRLFLAQPVTLFDYEALQHDFENIIIGRWVPLQNLHLTLQFFADKYEQEELIATLSGLELKAEASEIKGLDCFEHNQILYAKTDNSLVKTLHEQIIKLFDLPQKQEFIPHITLMRIKRVPHKELLEKRLRLYDDKPIGILQPSIQLIHSELTPKGAKYTVIKEF